MDFMTKTTNRYYFLTYRTINNRGQGSGQRFEVKLCIFKNIKGVTSRWWNRSLFWVGFFWKI